MDCRHLPAVALALCFVAQVLHAAEPQPLWAQSWRPELGFFDDGPTCLLDPPESISPDGFYLNFSWNARGGSVLWINWRTNNTPAVRLESDGSGDSWAITLEPWDSRYNGRRALLDSRVAGGILRSLELGHALTVVLSVDGAESQRYHVPAHGARIGVPMYQACIRSVIDDPPRYLFDPGRPFMGSYKAGERCEFTQIIRLQIIPLMVTLSADTDGAGGVLRFERPTRAYDPHGPLHTRETPDRIEAQPLFGPAFDLVEDFRYDITAGQLDELGAGLSRGETRKFSLTTPQGRQSTLTFGGKLGKPFAAMFAACRQARTNMQEAKSP
jgi:hypothetical protein